MKKTDTTAPEEAGALDYPALSQELAEVMKKLEEGPDIDAAVQAYQRGLEIVKLLEVQLQHAENRVSELREELASTEEE